MAGLAVDIGHIHRRRPGKADICNFRFTRSVDYTTDYGNMYRGSDVLKTGFKFIDRGYHIKILSGATGTGNQIDTFLAQIQALENIETYPDFFNRIRSQGNTDGIANTVHQQQTQANR